MIRSDPLSDEPTRLPGLYRKWELPEVLRTCTSYRIESAGNDADGTPLLAVYVMPEAPPSEATLRRPDAVHGDHGRVRGATPISRAVETTTMLTQSDLARRWKKSVRTLERWRVTGAGPEYLRLNGRVLYRLDAVVAFEEACRRRSTSDTTPSEGHPR